MLNAARFAGRATGKTLTYLQRSRQDLQLVLKQIQSPSMDASHSELQRNLNEFRSIQVEMMRMRSMSPRTLYTEVAQLEYARAAAAAAAGGGVAGTADAAAVPALNSSPDPVSSLPLSSTAAGQGAGLVSGAASSWPAAHSTTLGQAAVSSSASDAVNEALLNHKLYVMLKKSGAQLPS